MTQERTVRAKGRREAFLTVILLDLWAFGLPAQQAPPAENATARPGLVKQASADPRQQKNRGDADRLLQLAQQLKASVDKSNKDTLSVEVVREAEQMERLAHEVKENVRQK